MLLHLICMLFIVSVPLPSPSAAVDEIGSPRVRLALETIDPEDVYAFVGYMASDALRGRNAGEPGNDMAADWIGGFFERLGLKPGGDDGTYFQTFEFRPRRFSFRKEGNGEKKKPKKASTRNVIAVWEGSHPVLKKEAVVVGAHFDHVGAADDASDPGRMGRSPANDKIWNGADDNASGSAGVLEIAQAFASLRVNTARSVVFVLFSAEEHGLYGSKYYVEHPTFPLDRTMAMINLDMIGRNPDQPVYVIGADSAEGGVLEEIARECAECVPELEWSFTSNLFGGSDHMPFLGKRVPAVFFFTGLHRDYHQINDEVKRIDCERASKIIQTAFLMTNELANRPERLAFSSAAPAARFGISGYENRRRLGIRLGKRVALEELECFGFDEDQGAVRVSEVEKDSSAAKAGIEEDDLILRVGTVRLRAKEEVTSLREGIDSTVGVDEAPIEILRGGEVLLLTIRWDSRQKKDEAPDRAKE